METCLLDRAQALRRLDGGRGGGTGCQVGVEWDQARGTSALRGGVPAPGQTGGLLVLPPDTVWPWAGNWASTPSPVKWANGE